MDRQALIDLATGPVARVVMKLAAMTGTGAATLTQDRATQIATAILTVAVFAVEQWQSWYAHKRTATKAATGCAVAERSPVGSTGLSATLDSVPRLRGK